jgi:cytochrome d ubiquinol oxidase subunit II
MLTVWYSLVAFMIAAYVVLDGFDLGAGILYLLLAKTEEERRMVIRTVGPVWDGNEVWLLAGGGTLYFAFPGLYASGFSGFYLPLMIVLWLLILRGIGIELRMHIDSPVWRGLLGGCFSIASLLLAVFFGAALGNVLRGVPLESDGYFFLPLWTDWRAHPPPGVLDWFTVLSGVLSAFALSLHGAAYVAYKTTGDLNRRTKKAVQVLWPAVLVLTGISLAASLFIRPGLDANYRAVPALYLIPVLVVASLIAIPLLTRKGKELGAFLATGSYLLLMLGGAAAAMYPNLLFSIDNPALNITMDNSHSGSYALSVGLIWWSIGMAIAIGYFVFVYRTFRGKITEASSYGH